MLSLDGAIALGGRKQPLNERRPSSAKVIYVKYWPSGGWALTRENTVYIFCFQFFLNKNISF